MPVPASGVAGKSGIACRDPVDRAGVEPAFARSHVRCDTARVRRAEKSNPTVSPAHSLATKPGAPVRFALLA